MFVSVPVNLLLLLLLIVMLVAVGCGHLPIEFMWYHYQNDLINFEAF